VIEAEMGGGGNKVGGGGSNVGILGILFGLDDF